jgi:hypothetical protein
MDGNTRESDVADEIRNDNINDAKEISTADLPDVRTQKGGRLIESRRAVIQSRSEPRSRTASTGTTAGVAAARVKIEEELGPLFSTEEANDFRERWDSVQVAFVDEPRKAVEDADHLIAATMKRLAEIFAEERQKLEHQWDQGDNVSTEDLRVALRRYRSFFARLLRV